MDSATVRWLHRTPSKEIRLPTLDSVERDSTDFCIILEPKKLFASEQHGRIYPKIDSSAAVCNLGEETSFERSHHPHAYYGVDNVQHRIRGVLGGCGVTWECRYIRAYGVDTYIVIWEPQ